MTPSRRLSLGALLGVSWLSAAPAFCAAIRPQSQTGISHPVAVFGSFLTSPFLRSGAARIEGDLVPGLSNTIPGVPIPEVRLPPALAAPQAVAITPTATPAADNGSTSLVEGLARAESAISVAQDRGGDTGRALDLLYGEKARPQAEIEDTAATALAPVAAPVELGRDFAFPELDRFSISAEVAKVGVKALRDLFAREGPPRIFINRNADDALRVLERGDFSTIHTLLADRPDILPDMRDQFEAMVALRRSIEKRRGTFGDGQAVGRTVYGSVHLGDRVGSERFIADIIQGLRARAPRPTKPALGFYLSGGAVTFVMKPAALMKATFLGGDSFLKNDWKPGGIRHLPEVMMTALARIAFGHGEDAELRSILRKPAEARREALRRVLASDIFQIDYVEAQIREPSVDDVDHIVIKNDVKDWPGGYLPDPRVGSHAQALKRVRELAQRRGIPLIEGGRRRIRASSSK